VGGRVSLNQWNSCNKSDREFAVSRRLHIGGKVRKQGWEVLNAVAAPCVDHVCNASDLEQFADGTFEEIYASHVLEHFDYATNLLPTLMEWLRVLQPGGRLLVSVPDLDVLARLFLDKTSFDGDERYYIMRVIFGGHCDKYDYHLVGLNEEFLGAFLRDAGFVNLRRVGEFDIFDDTSNTRIGDALISLNVIAEKPKPPGSPALGDHNSRLDPAVSPGIQEEPADPTHFQPARDRLILETHDGILVSVPPTLGCITTYVLLEQERWFEREVEFVGRFLKHGMTAIDIGANLGLYSLAMSRAVGEAGQVFAYEPGKANRQHLENSIRLNRAMNISVSPCALSNTDRKGWLRIASSGEFNALVESECDGELVEAVDLTTLDTESRLGNWQAIDFVKIDAEEHEAMILVGGRGIFSRFSPLVMYEIKGSLTNNQSTRWMLELLGYRSYRLIGDASFLVPLGGDPSVDPYELNLFSAKPDRAAELARRGLLAGDPEPFLLSDSERRQALERMLARPYARSMEISIDDIVLCPFADALAAYAAYLYLGDMSVDRKYAALLAAFSSLGEFCRTASNPSALATYARVARDLGKRAEAIDALRTISQLADVEIDQPLFPALARFDDIEVGESVGTWFLAAATEQLEFLRAHSSYLVKDNARLNWLCNNASPSAEILRRKILVEFSQGTSRMLLQDYLKRLGDLTSSNAVIWGGGGAGLAGLR
jgi:FkbM family methyltransferase